MDLTFLSEQQIVGEKRLELFKKIGVLAVISDFAILLGGKTKLSNEKYTKDKFGYYWGSGEDGSNFIVDTPSKFSDNVLLRVIGGRPVLPLSVVEDYINLIYHKDTNGIPYLEFGYYPDKAAPVDMQKILSKEYKKNHLITTGNKYTIDSSSVMTIQQVSLKTLLEYQWNHKRYVRVPANFCVDKMFLSNGKTYRCKNLVWVEVSPIKWLIDESSKMMITEKIIFSGIQFSNYKEYPTNFENSNVKWFMDTYLSKEIVQNHILSYNEQEKKLLENYKKFKKVFERLSQEEKVVFALAFINQSTKDIEGIKDFLCDLEPEFADAFYYAYVKKRNIKK